MFGYHLYYSPINPQPRQNRFFYKIYGVMHVGERLRFLHSIKVINQTIRSPLEILDAGSGNGNYAFYLSRKFPHAKITAVDISREKIHKARKIANILGIKNVFFEETSLTTLKEKSQYDLVVCIDVLEHISNDILAINKMRDTLKPGGALILHVPKDRRLVYRHFSRFREFNIEDHVREEYKVEDISDKIRQAGLQVRKFLHTHGWFGSLAWEIDQVFIVYGSKLRYIFFPFLYVLMLTDVFNSKKNGNGFLFHCVKE